MSLEMISFLLLSSFAKLELQSVLLKMAYLTALDEKHFLRLKPL
jgi:hypothetical protein